MIDGQRPQVIYGRRYQWRMPNMSGTQAHELAAAYNMCIPVAQVLVNRGLVTREKIDDFLFTAHEREVADPVLLKDAVRVVERITRAFDRKEKILIVGDYDVDGITATSLMLVCLLPYAHKLNYFLPNRMKDGYGISSRIIQRAAESGYSLVITVDNGIAAIEPAAQARRCGIDLIVLDHHVPHAVLPEAYAIVDPLQKGCEYPFKHLAGVGVAFKVMSLLYQMRGVSLPPKVYELLLLGTVADVVPLVGENRFLVRKALTLVNDSPSESFNCLKNYAKITGDTVCSLDIAFSLAPQLNALGRMQDPRDGVLFLVSSQSSEIERIGKKLFELNQTRKHIERTITAEIIQAVKDGAIDLDHERIIVAASKQWPTGIIGLVASRLVNEFSRPAILLQIGEDGVARGSARSIPAFDMFNALESGAALMHHFGGHAAAAGLALSVDRIEDLKEHLERRMRETVNVDDLVAKIAIDASVSLSDATGKFVDDLKYFEPFGCENACPIFHVPEVTLIERPQLLKDAHVKCRVFSQGIIKPVIFFNRPELYTELCALGDSPFDVAVEVVENCWRDVRSIELKGIDIAVKGT